MEVRAGERAFESFLQKLTERAISAEFLANLEKKLQGDRTLVAIGEELGVLTQEEAAALRRDWFESSERWWHLLQPLEPILRQGLIVAINKGLETTPPLPIDFTWERDTEKFEIYILWNLRYVSFTLLTPSVPTEKNPPPKMVRSQLSPSGQDNYVDERTIVVKRVGPEVSSSANVQVLQMEGKIIAQRIRTAPPSK